MLEIRELDVGYGSIQALRGVGLTVNEGDIVCLIGANGAGKSTLLQTISGLLKPWRGTITFEGRDITGVPSDRVVKLGIAHCPENRHVWPQMTTYEHMQLGARGRKDADAVQADLERVYEHFPVLKERKSELGGNLSGGQQQMLAIGRALMSDPRLLMLDEPSLGLAPLMVEEVARAILSIHARGTTILLVEQNASLALKISDRAYVLETGRVVLSGSTADLVKDPRVQEAYLGGVVSPGSPDGEPAPEVRWPGREGGD